VELHSEVSLLDFLSPCGVLTVVMVVENHSPGINLEVELAVGAEASAVRDGLHEFDLVGEVYLGGLSESDLLVFKALVWLQSRATDEHEIGFGLHSREQVGASESKHGQLLDLVELHPVGHVLVSEVVGFQVHLYSSSICIGLVFKAVLRDKSNMIVSVLDRPLGI